MGRNGNKKKKKSNLFHSVYVRVLLLPAGYNIFGFWPYEML